MGIHFCDGNPGNHYILMKTQDFKDNSTLWIEFSFEKTLSLLLEFINDMKISHCEYGTPKQLVLTTIVISATDIRCQWGRAIIQYDPPSSILFLQNRVKTYILVLQGGGRSPSPLWQLWPYSKRRRMVRHKEKQTHQ